MKHRWYGIDGKHCWWCHLTQWMGGTLFRLGDKISDKGHWTWHEPDDEGAQP
jgi:hypothetical protein